MIEIGGYKHFSEFRHIYEKIEWFIYMVDISKYDTYSLSTRKVICLKYLRKLFIFLYFILIFQNLLIESVDEFKFLVTSPHTKQMSFVIFFNKFDIFKKKINYAHLKNHFTDYIGKQ